MKAAPLVERFWAKVEKRESGCWEWTAGTGNACDKNKRYGLFKYRGKVVGAHRMSWFLHYGKWPKKWILHHCDNPICVRPIHLYEGTGKNNADDRERRARGNHPHGNGHCNAALDDPKVHIIRVTNLPDKIWAERFGVTRETVRDARLGKTWKHINNPPPTRR